MSIFPNANNPISMAIANHHQNCDLAIMKLVDMYNDDYDISDRDIFNSVLARYGLLGDGFESEEAYIIQEVGRRIHRC